MSCFNFGGGNCCWIIILILILFCGCGNGYGNGCGNGCDNVCGGGWGQKRRSREPESGRQVVFSWYWFLVVLTVVALLVAIRQGPEVGFAIGLFHVFPVWLLAEVVCLMQI